ncbi:thrombospondin type-1 domain-containing protein 4 [Tachyglossus aculeatus]|uniref:thrombospondin type-1 domain-containing protein 4 n=1 Tax=Tachyglossus aculeatus TaxID=9261 RepID=UPI0018F4760A|nr:thrombospondin type-1 domain-containing protein 4 [Tachyglossus aculeatus]
MVPSLVGTWLRLLGPLLLFGAQLASPQAPAGHTKVPWAMEETARGPEEGASLLGVWGTWGPWSACSRSCSGGVMQQTRPCLPGLSRDPGPDGPPYPHHSVVSAIRPSLPLHRGREPGQAGLEAPSGVRDHSRGTPRGSRHSHRLRSKSERRSRNKGPITPGEFGYGKAPYIVPLRTDPGQPPLWLKRRRRRAEVGPGQHGGLDRGDPSPRTPAASVFQPAPAPARDHRAASPGLYYTQVGRGLSLRPGATDIECVGSYRQYKLCNISPCPESSRAIREVQCASYNNQVFMGRFYEWEPFAEVKGDQKCELNCRATGYRFYVRQAATVIDGTPCDQNGTAICVAGQCKSVGCDDFLGSDKVMDKCGVCGGDNTGCQVVSGVFKHTLASLGYHRIVEIPQGATKINVTEMHKSNNYLALRSRSGRSIINGNWAIDRPGRYEGGGTTFTYKRPNEISSTAGESFLADGPTDEILDVYMIHQQPNPGVHYEYIMPGANTISSQLPPLRRPGEPFNGQLVPSGAAVEEAAGAGAPQGEEPDESRQTFVVQQPGRFPSLRPDNQVPAGQSPRRSRDHNWKQVGMTECSASCGKGSQFPIFRCVSRNQHQEVPDSYCDPSTRPGADEESCNIFPCPAFWDIGEWSECSKTCGLGMQHRQVLCRQVFANRTLTVQPHRCQHLEKPETASTCQLKICSEWQIRTSWTSCSVPCGVGQRSRDVKCVSNLGDVVDDTECNLELRPSDLENCDMGACARSWFLTAWSERCSAECGTGVRTRSVVCLTNHVSSLPLEGCGNDRPPETAPCDQGPCVGKVEWFTGSWSQCSAECGHGSQQREVVCLRKSPEGFAVLDPHECASLDAPPNQQPCHPQPCGAKWFTTEWSACSKTCEGGFRVREVRCLSDQLAPSSRCDPQLKPQEKESCNPQDCMPEIDEHCQDQYYNCNVVVQARLCVYSYYQTACCASCARVASRPVGLLGRR